MMVTIYQEPIIRMSCVKHKTYKAIRPPKRLCAACWQMYGIRRAHTCIKRNIAKKSPELKVVI